MLIRSLLALILLVRNWRLLEIRKLSLNQHPWLSMGLRLTLLRISPTLVPLAWE